MAVGNVARIERGELKNELPLVSDLIKRVKSREVLFVSMLLHDMAKGLPGDHSDLGRGAGGIGLSAARPFGGRYGNRVLARAAASDDERRRAEARCVRSQDGAEFRRGGADAGAAAAAADSHGRRHQGGRTRRLERVEGAAPARALSRSRNADVGRRLPRPSATRGSRTPRASSASRLKDWPEAARRHAGGRHYDAVLAGVRRRRAGIPCPADQERRRQGREARHRRALRSVEHGDRDRHLHAGSSRAVLAAGGRDLGVERQHRRREDLHHDRRLCARRLPGAGRVGRPVRRRRPHRALAADDRQDAGGRNPAARGVCQAHARPARGRVQDPLAGDFRQRGVHHRRP